MTQSFHNNQECDQSEQWIGHFSQISLYYQPFKAILMYNVRLKKFCFIFNTWKLYIGLVVSSEVTNFNVQCHKLFCQEHSLFTIYLILIPAFLSIIIIIQFNSILIVCNWISIAILIVFYFNCQSVLMFMMTGSSDMFISTCIMSNIDDSKVSQSSRVWPKWKMNEIFSPKFIISSTLQTI